MGASLTTDARPFEWCEMELCATRSATSSAASSNPSSPTSPQGSSLKVWCLSAERRKLPGKKSLPCCRPVNMGGAGVVLHPSCCYVALVLKPRGGGFGSGGAEPVVGKLTRVLHEVCTPRGLEHPSSTGCHPEVTIYVLAGREAPGTVRAAALLRGMHLERLFLEHPRLSSALLSRRDGQSVPVTSSVTSSPSSPPSQSRQHAVPHLLKLLLPGHKSPRAPFAARKRPGEIKLKLGAAPVPSSPHPSPLSPVTGTSSPGSPHSDDDTDDDDASLDRRLPCRAATGTLPQEAWVEAEDEKVAEERAREKLHYWSPRCSDVLPYLCVGGQVPAENLETLLTSGVTHVLNTVEMLVECCFPDHFTYLSVEMRDTVNEDISVIFPHVVAHVEKVRTKPGGKLFVHCQQGSSRSCTLVMAYLLWLRDQPYDAVLEWLRGRRGIAKPNLGFQTRLKLWEERLSNPPKVQVYRLQPFSAVTTSPFVLAYEPLTAGKLNSVTQLDPRTCYLICDRRGDAPSDHHLYLWKGSECTAAFLEEAQHLTPDILMYTTRDPPQALTKPQVVAQGSEPEPLAALLYGGSPFTLSPPGPVSCYDELFADVEAAAAENQRFLEGEIAKERRESERATHRVRDLLALKGGDATLGGATPRLKGQKIEAIDMFFYLGPMPPPAGCLPDGMDLGSLFSRHPTYGTRPFDDDEFSAFREEAADSTCAFIKHRPDQKLLDFWSGCGTPERRTDDIVPQLLSLFQAWTGTPQAPVWTRHIIWDAVRCSYTIDEIDTDKDDMFYGRWVQD